MAKAKIYSINYRVQFLYMYYYVELFIQAHPFGIYSEIVIFFPIF